MNEILWTKPTGPGGCTLQIWERVWGDGTPSTFRVEALTDGTEEPINLRDLAWIGECIKTFPEGWFKKMVNAD